MPDDNGANAGTNNGTQGTNATGAGSNDNSTSAATGAGQTFTQADLDRVLTERLARERAKFADYGDLKAKATQLDELQESQKTELQKATDRIAALQAENQVHKVGEVRRKAAADAGLSPELAEFITAADPEAALEQAKKLAARVKPPEPKDANLRQGAQGSSPKPKGTPDEWIRRAAGR